MDPLLATHGVGPEGGNSDELFTFCMFSEINRRKIHK